MVRLSDVIGVSIMIHVTYTLSRKLYQKITEEDEIDTELLNKSASSIQKCWLSRVRKVPKVPKVPKIPKIQKPLELEYEFIQDYQGFDYEYVQNL